MSVKSYAEILILGFIFTAMIVGIAVFTNSSEMTRLKQQNQELEKANQETFNNNQMFVAAEKEWEKTFQILEEENQSLWKANQTFINIEKELLQCQQLLNQY